MSILHLCNSFFEFELAGSLPSTLEEAMVSDAIFLQLQFLPLSYANPGEKTLVSELPSNFPTEPFALLETPPKDGVLQTWGASLLIKEWADKWSLEYEIPPWDVVKRVNSKVYSFEKSPLPGARLLTSFEKLPPHFVLKSCFGTAGRGHIKVDHPKAKDFCKREWNQNRVVVAEPWVETICDFSTQWEISKDEITLIGTAFLETSPTGKHVGNVVGDEAKEAKFAKEILAHKEFVLPTLKEMKEMGYFGPVGFDAFIYRYQNEVLLQPIVEINARKTMGWLTLKIQKTKAPENIVSVSYLPSKEGGILPLTLGSRTFSRQLFVTIQ